MRRVLRKQLADKNSTVMNGSLQKEAAASMSWKFEALHWSTCQNRNHSFVHSHTHIHVSVCRCFGMFEKLMFWSIRCSNFCVSHCCVEGKIQCFKTLNPRYLNTIPLLDSNELTKKCIIWVKMWIQIELSLNLD